MNNSLLYECLPKGQSCPKCLVFYILLRSLHFLLGATLALQENFLLLLCLFLPSVNYSSDLIKAIVSGWEEHITLLIPRVLEYWRAQKKISDVRVSHMHFQCLHTLLLKNINSFSISCNVF